MPLPIILGGLAAIAGAAGIGTGVKGAIDSKKANDMMKAAKYRNEENLDNFNEISESTQTAMNKLGKLEMTVAKDFERFSDAFEKIKSRPDFSARKFNVDIEDFNYGEIRTVSVAASAFLGAAGGGAAGAVFGTAAAAGTTAAVMALGTASTGTAIATLSGAAATNAALAAIGGGALAAGGGGIALGTTILGASTLGVGFLVGGVILAATGSKVKEKAYEAYSGMLENEEAINKSIKYFTRIRRSANKLYKAIKKVCLIYEVNVVKLIELVNQNTDWSTYDDDERLLIENNILLVTILHKMINTPLLKVTKTDKKGNPTETDLDTKKVNSVITSSLSLLSDNGIG